jgi:nicotinate-nucleotide adenylyltransferase
LNSSNSSVLRHRDPAFAIHGDRRIGLLGGSFNPAHEGHRHISLLALKLLGLHQVWWLVSPQNPLKPSRGMAPFEDRTTEARVVARHPLIRVSEIEASLGTRYTADTLQVLNTTHRHMRFVWIMGADNLLQLPGWRRWPDIFESVPIAVFDRPTYSLRALQGKAARRFRGARIHPRQARRLASLTPPAWVFLDRARDPRSATAIRVQRGDANPS